MANTNINLDEDGAQGVLLDDTEFLREIVERVVQEILEAQMETQIGAAPHERNKERRGMRNGYKTRSLRTRVGTLNFLIPQDREGTFSTSVFARYQRNEKALVLALMEMYIQGVSTRKVREVTEVLCGTSFSKSQVSALSGQLDAELNAWRRRPLSARSYPYLFVDANYKDVRIGGRVVSQGVLIVSAVRDDGKREKRKELAGDLREIFTAKDKDRARELSAAMSGKWQKSHPKIAEMIEENIEECFSSFSFPLSHRPRIRTTNSLERVNQEIKRRTRVVRIFPNRESCLRLISALCVEYSEEWTSGKCYLNMEELADLEVGQFSTGDDQKERDLAAVI